MGVGRRGTTSSGDRGEPQRKSLMAMYIEEAEPKANLLEGKKSCQPTPPLLIPRLIPGKVDMLP